MLTGPGAAGGSASGRNLIVASSMGRPDAGGAYPDVVIELDDLPPLRSPLMLAAFEGWNDAGEAASAVIAHLAAAWDAQPVATIDPEEYYDLQVNRPRISTVDGTRRITWPSTTLLVATPEELDHDLILVDGIEPSMRWRAFCAELLAFADSADATLLVCLGALLAEAPHTRPLPVGLSSADPVVRERYGAVRNTYEGPTGIVGVLADAAFQLDVPALSCWASVPHYAAGTHSPKASLALLRALEDLFSWTLPHGDLEERARAWERGVDQLAEGDDEIASYVKALEESSDAAEHPQASGDAIAREFERYLRGRDDPR